MHNYVDLLVTYGFLGALMWGMMKFMLRNIHRDLLEIRNEVKEIRTEIRKADARIDHLYENNNRLYRTLLEIVKK